MDHEDVRVASRPAVLLHTRVATTVSPSPTSSPASSALPEPAAVATDTGAATFSAPGVVPKCAKQRVPTDSSSTTLQATVTALPTDKKCWWSDPNGMVGPPTRSHSISGAELSYTRPSLVVRATCPSGFTPTMVVKTSTPSGGVKSLCNAASLTRFPRWVMGSTSHSGSSKPVAGCTVDMHQE